MFRINVDQRQVAAELESKSGMLESVSDYARRFRSGEGAHYTPSSKNVQISATIRSDGTLAISVEDSRILALILNGQVHVEDGMVVFSY